jgi:hypothetical protein
LYLKPFLVGPSLLVEAKELFPHLYQLSNQISGNDRIDEVIILPETIQELVAFFQQQGASSVLAPVL